MSERVDGNANDIESRHNPEEKNEYKKYPLIFMRELWPFWQLQLSP